MKNLKFFLFIAIIAISGVFTSCSDDEDSKPFIDVKDGAIVLQYGSYQKQNGEISFYSYASQQVNNSVYKTNTEVDYGASIESGIIHNNKLILMGNEADKVDIIDLDPKFNITSNPISGSDIVKPKHCVAKDNKLYVACWGNVTDWNVMANSYLAIIDLTTKEIKKVAKAGGLFGLAIQNNKLYAASYMKGEVYIMDLASETFTGSITIGSHPRFIKVINDSKIIVSHNNSQDYSVTPAKDRFSSEKLGLSIINTTDNTVEKFIKISTIGADGNFDLSSDKSKAYIVAGGNWYDTGEKDKDGKAIWKQKPANVSSVDLTSGELTEKISGGKYQAIDFNSEKNQFYISESPDAKTPGSVTIYDTNFKEIKKLTVGIAPKQVLFY